MKSLALPFVMMIGTATLIFGTLIPPAVVKLTIDKELILTYEYEKSQHALLSLLYSHFGGRDTYSVLSEKAFFENLDCNSNGNQPDGSNPACPAGYTCRVNSCAGVTTRVLKEKLDDVIGPAYCITTETPKKILTGRVIAPEGETSNEVLKRVCASTDGIRFDTIIVLPYNKAELVKLLRIGLG
jgi:hypothetical protein